MSVLLNAKRACPLVIAGSFRDNPFSLIIAAPMLETKVW